MLTRLRECISDLTARVRCALTEHEDVRQFTQGRMWLLCLKCGRETRGWQTGKVLVPASFVGIDQQRATRQRDLARLQARWRLRERA